MRKNGSAEGKIFFLFFARAFIFSPGFSFEWVSEARRDLFRFLRKWWQYNFFFISSSYGGAAAWLVPSTDTFLSLLLFSPPSLSAFFPKETDLLPEWMQENSLTDREWGEKGNFRLYRGKKRRKRNESANKFLFPSSWRDQIMAWS